MLTNSDFTFTLSVSTQGYQTKPIDKECKKIAFKPQKLTIDMALNNALDGRIFCYSFKSNNHDGEFDIDIKDYKHYVSTSTIIYDFDKMDIQMNDFISSLKYLPTFAYTSYRNGLDGWRYRLAYVFDDTIYGKDDFEVIYNAIGNANSFVKETKKHGGWDYRSAVQMYFGTHSKGDTYKSNYIYNISDFTEFIVPITKEEKSKNKQSKKVNGNKYKDIDKSFLDDFNNLTYDEFFNKYFDAFHCNYEKSLESTLTLSPNEMWYEFPDDYLTVIRKRNGKHTLKWDIGQDRKKKLYITAQIMVHNLPDISLENLIYNLVLERNFYYKNFDNKIDNQILVQTAINAFHYDINLNPSKHGKFKVNKEYWNEQGIGVRQAVGYVRRERRLQEILPYIDCTKSLPQNHKILEDNGIKISLRTLQRMVARGDISIVMYEDIYKRDNDTLLSKCRNATNKKDAILELIRKNDTITVSEIASILNIDKSTAQRNINKMRGVCIEREGTNRSGRWVILDTCTYTEPEQNYTSTCTMSEFELLEYNFENDRTTIETPQPMTDDELMEDMFNDGWTEQEILDFFSIYAVA